MLLILITLINFTINQTPLPPDSIITQICGDTTSEIEFIAQSTDPDNDKISYQFDWGDGLTSDWSEFNQSDYMFSKTHLYKNIGNFLCHVRVKDEMNNISDWSIPCTMSIKSNLLKWTYPTNSGIYSGIAIGQSEEIYCTNEQGELISLNPDGTLRWSFKILSSIYSAPVIGKNAVYVTNTEGRIYAVDFAGQELWRFQADASIYSTPALSNKGTIFFGCDDGNIYTLSSSGKLLWKFQAGDEIAGSPSIASDGTVYIGSDAVYAITDKGKKKWTFYPAEEDEAYFFSTSSIDSDGTIYLGGTDGALYAITNQGRLKWRAITPDEDAIRAGVAIDNQGIIYFGAENGILYKKDKFGEVIPVFESDYYIFSTPAIDSLGNVYFVSDDGFLYCLRRDGKMLFKWQIAEDSKEIMYSPSPIINDDGTVYVGSWEGNIYAFTGFAPPAKSAWPFFRYNHRNTGSKQK
jgi:outer membrane protein assembly factor BamB